MEKTKNIIIIVLLAISIILGIFVGILTNNNDPDTTIDKNDKLIDGYTKSIDSLKNEIKKQDSIIIIHEDKLKLLDKDLDTVYIEKERIKNQADEKIRIINNYTNDQLFMFFSNIETKADSIR